MLADETIYKFNVENLRSLEIALAQIKLIVHQAIATDNHSRIQSLTRLFALTLGAWAETRLRKLLYERNGFRDEQKSLIDQEKSYFDRWKKTIEIAIRTHYSLPGGPLDHSTLPHSVCSKYETLNEILEQDLRPVIEIRNKLAHGQWLYPFTESMKDLSVPQKTAMERENILSLQLKHLMLTHLSQMIHDLVVSRPTFERDFDANFRKFWGTKQNLIGRSYQTYREQLKQRYVRGREKRKKNLSAIN